MKLRRSIFTAALAATTSVSAAVTTHAENTTGVPDADLRLPTGSANGPKSGSAGGSGG